MSTSTASSTVQPPQRAYTGNLLIQACHGCCGPHVSLHLCSRSGGGYAKEGMHVLQLDCAEVNKCQALSESIFFRHAGAGVYSSLMGLQTCHLQVLPR